MRIVAAGRRAAPRNWRALTYCAVTAPFTDDWAANDRVITAGMLDVLWAVVSYERLVADWELSPEDAIKGITWVMGPRPARHPPRPSPRPDRPTG